MGDYLRQGDEEHCGAEERGLLLKAGFQVLNGEVQQLGEGWNFNE